MSNSVNLEVHIEVVDQVEMYYCTLIADNKIIPLSQFSEEDEAKEFQHIFWQMLREWILKGDRNFISLSELVESAEQQF